LTTEGEEEEGVSFSENDQQPHNQSQLTKEKKKKATQERKEFQVGLKE